MTSDDRRPESGSLDITQSATMPEFVNYSSRLSCMSCKRLAFSPVQLPCGHRLCLDCSTKFTEGKGEEENIRCPSQDCESFNKKNIYPDYSAKREMKQLAVFCSYKIFGCTETMAWKDLKMHTDKCKHRTKRCVHCNLELPSEIYQTHIENECHRAPCSCPYNCGDVPCLKRNELENHRKHCRLKPKQCIYKNMGCNFESTEDKMPSHENNFKYHLEIIIEQMFKLKAENCTLRQTLQKTVADVTSLEKTLSQCMNEREILKNQYHELEKEFRTSEKRQLDVLSTQAARLIKLETSSKSVDKFNDDLQIITMTQSQQETKINELEKLDRSISLPEDIRNQFIQHDRAIGSHDVRLAELDLRVQCLQTANYEGVLIWRIADYDKRKREAVDGTILSLYSQPFYTSRYGYKMCGRVYLNGDGAGKGTHLSLFFVVMQGDYDDILPWPFKQKVTLTLLDQRNNRRHQSDTFRANPSSHSFQKPREAMNIASGCPRFVEQSALENDDLFLRNNTIYVKITVDTSDLLIP